jgi:hypothetical protein
VDDRRAGRAAWGPGAVLFQGSVTGALAELGLELELSGWVPWHLLERGTEWILAAKSELWSFPARSPTTLMIPLSSALPTLGFSWFLHLALHSNVATQPYIPVSLPPLVTRS